MDYGRLLSRAFDIVWEHKFLILLGLIVALGSGGGSAGASGGSNFNFQGPDADYNFQPPSEFPDFGEGFGTPVLATILIILLIGIGLIIGLAVWVVSTIARGALIDGVSTIQAGMASSFAQAWSAGWQKIWTLLGIGILPAIPAFILVISGLGLTGVFAVLSGGSMSQPRSGLAAIFGILACIAVPIVLVLNLLRTFANRACMLEDLGVFESYGRGWTVITQNVGPALLLFLIQIGISVGLGLVMILPGILMALCCLLWPLLLLIQGTISAYFSTLWTLAWQQWTGGVLTDVREEITA